MVAKPTELGIGAPFRVGVISEKFAMLQMGAVAFLIDRFAGEAVAGCFRCDVVEVVEAEVGEVAGCVGAFVDEVESGADAAFAVEVEAPAREQPAVIGLAGDRVGVAAEHDAVGVEKEGSPV